MADGTTLGSGVAAGDGTIRGIARITVLITADGMADGIHIGDITITFTDLDTALDISEAARTITRMYGTDQDIRQDQNAYSAAAHHLEAA